MQIKIDKVRLSSARINWLDIAKAYGIILVIYGHFVLYATTAAAALEAKFIYSFHMPLFFVLCGYLAKKNLHFSWDYFRSRFVRRVVPAFIFNILGLAVSFSWNLLNGSVQVKQYAYGFLSMLRGDTVYNLTTWFLICLFVVELIHSLVCRYVITRRKLLVSIALFLCAGWLLSQKNALLLPIAGFTKKFWHINTAIVAYAFYQVGILLKSLISKLENRPRSYTLLFMGLAFMILLFSFNLNPGLVLMIGSVYGNFSLFTLSAITGSIFIILLALCTPYNRAMAFIGQNALLLMLLDGFFRPIDRRIFILLGQRFALESHLSVIISGVIITAIFTAIWLYLIAIAKKLIPGQAMQYIGIRASA